ncbi:MAG: TetR/AcrR family transcriptional regulator [Solirubrobacterales bacterium]
MAEVERKSGGLDTLEPMADRRTAILEAACRVIARRGVRGLRVEELAREAGISVSLIYYYFEGRENLLRRTLEFVDQRASGYTMPNSGRQLSITETLSESLAGEVQDDPKVRENSAVWGELRSSAWFDEAVRETVSRLTEKWVSLVADRIRTGQATGEVAKTADPRAAAERLTALVEGVSGRWLAGEISADHAQRLIRTGVRHELE